MPVFAKRSAARPKRPRLCVYRSLNHIYAQIIDDTKGVTLAAASTHGEGRHGPDRRTLTRRALPRSLASSLPSVRREAGIKQVVFDRGGYVYTGRVAELAAGAREAGLELLRRRNERMQRIREQVSEFKEKLVAVNRVAKTVKGGRNFRFSALMVVGDEKGRVGVGMGKAAEIPEAIRKGTEDAKKHHDQRVSCRAPPSPMRSLASSAPARSLLLPAPEGTGVIAGGAVRAVLELAGIKDIRTKSYRLQQPDQHGQGHPGGPAVQLRTAEEVAKLRGKTVEEISGLREDDEQ